VQGTTLSCKAQFPLRVHLILLPKILGKKLLFGSRPTSLKDAQREYAEAMKKFPI
jgi:hypothetical protein